MPRKACSRPHTLGVHLPSAERLPGVRNCVSGTAVAKARNRPEMRISDRCKEVTGDCRAEVKGGLLVPARGVERGAAVEEIAAGADGDEVLWGRTSGRRHLGGLSGRLRPRHCCRHRRCNKWAHFMSSFTFAFEYELASALISRFRFNFRFAFAFIIILVLK